MLVNYSVSIDPSLDPTDLFSKLQLSMWSLRQHNNRMPIEVFAHSPPPETLRQICQHYGAELVEQGSYAGRLAALCPEGWPVLANHPTLHKFLNFGEINGVEQVLLCDCDTLFRDDVERLFAAYTTADVYGREEVHSGRSRYGPNREFLDEPALRRLAASLGVAFVPPFNTGVVLVNHSRATDLVRLDEWFVHCVWHFMVWMSTHPQHTAGTGYGTLDGISAAYRLASPEQLARALPYPSANQWIVEEVATWLALGALPGITTGHFSPADVPQNGELADPDLARDDWLLCHYFSTDPTTALSWLDARQPAHSSRS
jgi:hypothetical protein